jgi:hypothetical protein
MAYDYIFRHCVTDGFVYVGNGIAQSVYPYLWWITQEPTYPTPPANAAYMQVNITTGANYWSDGSTQKALPTGFAALAAGYIAKQSVYDAAYALYINTPTTLIEAQAIKYGELDTKNVAIQDGHVIASTVGAGNQEFFSDGDTFQDLSNELVLFTAAGDVPTGYTVSTVDYIAIACTLADLGAIVKLIQTLYYECRLTYDTHSKNIEALTTIAAVMAYDVTTGWPTVPFTSPS